MDYKKMSWSHKATAVSSETEKKEETRKQSKKRKRGRKRGARDEETKIKKN
jgi:hypothetical protein